MLRQSVRRFATTAVRRAVAPAAAHDPAPRTIAVSQAQGVSRGLTEGTNFTRRRRTAVS